MPEFSIREVIHNVTRGTIRIPDFQRGFEWDADSVAFLLDTIYKEYPFGTIQLWRTKEQLRTERQLGPFKLFIRDENFPIDYILDGQQRITSIFGVFNPEASKLTDKDHPFNIYFDFKASIDNQESQFFALSALEADPDRFFPMNCLFDTVGYRKATSNLDSTTIKRIDELQAIFKETKIPYQVLHTQDKKKAAIAFERINRKGIPLDIFQLLTAWTWSEDFVLRRAFEDLAEELEPYGFEEVGSNVNLLLRICAAVLTRSAASSSLMDMNGNLFKNRFDEITNGVKGAIDFLRVHLKVQKLKNLPYENLLVPLSVFFSSKKNRQLSITDAQRKTLERWFWRKKKKKRYSAGLLKALNRDIEEMVRLKNEGVSNLASISCSMSEEHFLDTEFQMGTVSTKTFVLMLAHCTPLSLLSGVTISLADVLKDYNRNEFHHIYPKSFLKIDSAISENKESCLANFCFISKADNSVIGGKRPSEYKKYMQGDLKLRFSNALIDEDSFSSDSFDLFVRSRAKLLMSKAKFLIN